MKIRTFILTLGFCSLVVPASAQDVEIRSYLNWDAPMFFAPRPLDDLGLYVVQTKRPDFDGGDATGLQGIWRQTGNLHLGVRAGVADMSDIGSGILLGAELYNDLNSLFPGLGVDIAWNLGLGAVFGDNENGTSYTTFTVPLGVSVGLKLGSGSVNVTPYIHPRVSLDVIAVESNGAEETDTNFPFTADIGADVALGERFLLRAGYSLGERDAFGVGIALRIPRGISVVR